MEKKTFPPRRSSTLLRRIASAALLMLTFHTAAMAITVTLKPGRGSGSDIVIDSEEPANKAADWRSAANGQFWLEGEQLYFKYPDCPGSYTAPGSENFKGWSKDSEDGSKFSPGYVYQINDDLTLYAKWGPVEFSEITVEANYKYAITNYSPREVSLIEFDYYETSDFSIPASVEYNGEEYAVTELGDRLGFQNYDITTLTIPATVRSIGSEVFCECPELTTVTFAEGSQLETFGNKAFNNCPYLKSVYGIPGCAKVLNNGSAFINCPLETVTIVGHGYINSSPWEILLSVPSIQWTLPSNTFGGATWTTFYNPDEFFLADTATTVYKAELVGNTLLLHEVQDRIINRRTAVILKSSGNPVLTKTSTASTDESPNDLWGSDMVRDTPSGTYMLSGGAEGLGFYPYSGAKLNPGIAYVDIWPYMDVNGFVGMTETPNVGTTAIPSMPVQEAAQDEAAPWFTIDGRRLPGQPARPGIYIRSGRKAVIR